MSRKSSRTAIVGYWSTVLESDCSMARDTATATSDDVIVCRICTGTFEELETPGAPWLWMRLSADSTTGDSP
ncbi:MAG: hypothetical protein ACK6DC_09540, partial [Planctomycetota bacterium]